MRKLSFAVLGILAVLFMTASCSPEKEYVFEQFQWKDSTKYSVVELSIELPLANMPAAELIRKHLTNVVGEQVDEFCQDSHATTSYDPTSGTDIAEYYGKAITEQFDKESKEMQEVRKSTAPDNAITPIIPYTAEIKLQKERQTEKYVVFHSTGNLYTGGAHPNEIGAGHLTYALADGECLTQVIDSTRVTDIQPIIREGLKRYFKEVGTMGNQALNDILLIDSESIPLPACTPYFTADGVAFEYKQYEIAPYAAGMPTFVVPYEKAKPFMTTKAQELLNEE